MPAIAAVLIPALAAAFLEECADVAAYRGLHPLRATGVHLRAQAAWWRGGCRTEPAMRTHGEERRQGHTFSSSELENLL